MSNNEYQRNREGGYREPGRDGSSPKKRRGNTVSSQNIARGEVFTSKSARRSATSSRGTGSTSKGGRSATGSSQRMSNRGEGSSQRSSKRGSVASQRNRAHDEDLFLDEDFFPIEESRGAGSSQRSRTRNSSSSQRNGNRNSNSSQRNGSRNSGSSQRNGSRGSDSSQRNGTRNNRPAQRNGNRNSGSARRSGGRGGASSRRRPSSPIAALLQRGPARIVLLALAAIVVLLLAVFVVKSFLCKGSVTIEAGESYSISDFLKSDNPEATFTEKSDTVDTNVPGDYKLQIKNGIFTHNCTLHVKDTIAPQGTANNMSTVLGKELEASAFVTDIVDVTPVTVSYSVKPDFTQEGDQNVELILEDTSKNKTTLTATLTLMRDTEAPVITGVRDITHSIGSGISYKSEVTVTDNLDPDVELEVNTDGVDLNTEGTYQVTYTATDFSGNSTSLSANVIVIRSTYDEETIMGIANDILAEITNDGMSDYDKASAIYDWVRSHIGYANSSSEAWTDAAYEGMVQGRGDCWAYTSASRALLTAAGIKNMVIRKIPSDTTHAWNLVDLGEGWYHFDTTPRASHNERFFMWTDAQLMDYSNAYGLTHNYDHDQYPAVN